MHSTMRNHTPQNRRGAGCCALLFCSPARYHWRTSAALHLQAQGPNFIYHFSFEIRLAFVLWFLTSTFLLYVST
jgi:hypothetical protein